MTTIAAVATDVALLGTIEDIARLPAEEQPAYITAALAESRKWLHLATESTNPRPFAEVKAWAASVAEYARQKGLASEIVADGQEMLRRAERAVGQAVRNGQEAGEIRRMGERGSESVSYERARYGQVETVQEARGKSTNSLKASPTDFASHEELSVAGYPMAAASDEHFESALTEARAEGNLSRANVVRKVKGQAPPQTRIERADRIADLAAKGYAAAQMVEQVGVSEERIREIARAFGIDMPGERAVARTRRIDSLRVARETVTSLEGIVSTLALINAESLRELDPSEATQWVASLDSSLRALNRFHKALREATS